MQYIIRSKNVFDAVSDRPFPASILVKDSKIEKIMPYEVDLAGKAIPVIDYGDKLVMPAFVDAHTHFVTGAISSSKYVCDTLASCKSEAECVQMIADFAHAHPELKRIRGTGWFIGGWTDMVMPTKTSLDAVLPDIPVYLQCADCHSMWMNSAALEEADIHPDPDFPNGIIETDENGELTGMLLEPAAMAPANEKYMDFTLEEQKEIFRDFQKILKQYGICALSEMFAEDYTQETMQVYDLVRELDEEGLLAANVYPYTKLFGYTDFTAYHQMETRYQTPHFRIGGVKGFIDGVTETYTGMLLEPYTDRPETNGLQVPLWPKDRLQEEIAAAGAEGIQVRLHCIGDGAVRLALDLYEHSVSVNGEKAWGNTIEHIENIHPSDLTRFAENHVIPSVQPFHIVLSNGDKIDRIGRDRCQLEWPFRSIMEAGGQLAFGTDFPVVSIEPMQNIQAAVTRCNEAGKVVCQNPWETVSVADALKAYTIGAARAYRREGEYGSIQPGMQANLIVLDRNPFEIPENEISEIKVLDYYFEGTKQ